MIAPTLTSLEIMSFEVEGREFGIQSRFVKEVLRAVALTEHPQPHALLEGLLNIRGRILPVVNLRSILNLDARPLNHSDHLLVISVDDLEFVVRVDRAIDLVRVSRDQHAAQEVTGQLVELVAKTNDQTMPILDPQAMLAVDHLIDFVVFVLQSSGTEESH